MAFTKVIGAGIKTTTDARVGILTAEKFDGPFDNLVVNNDLTVGGTITYDDVKNIDSIGIITARKDIHVGAGVSAVGVITASHFSGPSEVGIQSAGVQIGAGITQLNFVGTGNTFSVTGTTVDISIQGGGGTGAGGTWKTYTAGIATNKSIGVNTSNFDDPKVVGTANSFQGIYVSNGMYIHDNTLNGNHYIGTAYNGLMAGPVTINGVLTIDGNYVVV